MTTILWHDNRLYADTSMIKGSENFLHLGKICAIAEPRPLKATPEGSARIWNFDDVIHGFAYTGVEKTAKRFVHALLSFDDAAIILLHYELAHGHGLANVDNAFEVVLIGEKGNYRFDFNLEKFEHQVLAPVQTWAMGSGGATAFDRVDEKSDPIRAMFAAFLYDGVSGGPIEVWEMFHEAKRFTRVGLVNECTAVEMRHAVRHPKRPWPWDLITNPTKKRK